MACTPTQTHDTHITIINDFLEDQDVSPQLFDLSTKHDEISCQPAPSPGTNTSLCFVPTVPTLSSSLHSHQSGLSHGLTIENHGWFICSSEP